MKNRIGNEFSKETIVMLASRARYQCTLCNAATIGPSGNNSTTSVSVGVAAHICAASPKGPRYDPNMSSEQRGHINNGIHLCANCSSKIDKNNGMDFSIEFLIKKKAEHEKKMSEQVGQPPHLVLSSVAGQHEAQGVGTVIGLEINQPARIEPGTISRAVGIGHVVGTKIGN